MHKFLSVFAMQDKAKFLPDIVPVHLTYEILRKGNPVLATELHENKSVKPFCYGGRCRSTQYFLYFSTVDDNIADAFQAGLKANPEFNTEVPLELAEYHQLPNYPIKTKIKVSTISPITLSKPVGSAGKLKKQYIELPETPKEFFQELNNNLQKKANIFRFSFKPINIECLYSKHAWVSLYGGKILGYRADLILDGDEDSLSFALHAGLGERTGLGFGAVIPGGM